MVYDGPNRRRCNDCVKDDFGTVKKLVFLILAVIVLGNGWLVYANAGQSDKDSDQDSRLASLETRQDSQDDILCRLDKNMQKLIDLNVETNLKLEKHISSAGGTE